MRHQLEAYLLVLAVGAAVAIGAKRWGVPYNVVLVIVGLLLVFLDVVPRTPMNPEVILVVFLPILVFEGALFADLPSMREAARPILALSVPGVALSLLGTAAVATWVLDLRFAAALLLGALLAITDTVSVLLAFRSVRVPHRLAAIMEGESLFNDGTALVLVSLCTTVLMTGVFDPTHTAKSLLIAIAGGLVAGGAFGAVGAAVLRYTPDHLTAILSSLVLVFAAALVSEHGHASPVIAVVVAGTIIGRAARRVLEPSRILALHGFWETAGFGLNVLIFLLVGMQISARMLFEEAGVIALALVALHIGRAVAVYGCFGVLRLISSDAVPMRWQHVMVLGNIKGSLSMAAVLALPAAMPNRERFITIVFGVTFVTLMTQALPFRRILRSLGVAHESAHPELDAARAVLVGARRGQAELDELLASGLISRRDHAERRAAFQREIIHAETTLHVQTGDADYHAVADTALITAQKSAVLEAARRGLISEEAANHRVNQLDHQLLQLALHE